MNMGSTQLVSDGDHSKWHLTWYFDGGGDRNRTGVQGFAGPCLSHSATPPGRSPYCRQLAASVSAEVQHVIQAADLEEVTNGWAGRTDLEPTALALQAAVRADEDTECRGIAECHSGEVDQHRAAAPLSDLIEQA